MGPGFQKVLPCKSSMGHLTLAPGRARVGGSGSRDSETIASALALTTRARQGARLSEWSDAISPAPLHNRYGKRRECEPGEQERDISTQRQNVPSPRNPLDSEPPHRFDDEQIPEDGNDCENSPSGASKAAGRAAEPGGDHCEQEPTARQQGYS